MVLVVCLVGALLVLYAVDRIVKARSQLRRLRRMDRRLTAATRRGEKQQEGREAAVQVSAVQVSEAQVSEALTAFMPAISHPPLKVPCAGRQEVPAGRQGAPENDE